MILTPVDVATFALQVGFTGQNAVIAVAIAHAESGFNTDAIGDQNLTEPGEESVGLWQINYRPSRDLKGGIRDPQANLSPGHNAIAAFLISRQGTTFTPWSTYVNHAYGQYMDEARIAVAQAIALMNGVTMAAAPPIVGFAMTADGQGYVYVTADGAIFAFGTARYAGRLEDVNGSWQPLEPSK